MSTYVYILKVAEKYYKIGFSKGLNNRLQSFLNFYKDINLNESYLIEVKDEISAKEIEKILHNVFSANRVSFDKTDDYYGKPGYTEIFHMEDISNLIKFIEYLRSIRTDILKVEKGIRLSIEQSNYNTYHQHKKMLNKIKKSLKLIDDYENNLLTIKNLQDFLLNWLVFFVEDYPDNINICYEEKKKTFLIEFKDIFCFLPNALEKDEDNVFIIFNSIPSIVNLDVYQLSLSFNHAEGWSGYSLISSYNIGEDGKIEINIIYKSDLINKRDIPFEISNFLKSFYDYLFFVESIVCKTT